MRDSADPQNCAHGGEQTTSTSTVYWLQGITILWMIVECAVSLGAAWNARSAALLAFGGDSLVELLSASLVLSSFLPRFSLSRERAARWSGVLLFALAASVAIMSITALIEGTAPEANCAGIAVTSAALLVMPTLAWLKRRTAQATGSRALSADSVQSTACAYLAATTLVGLGVDAIFHIHWVDAAAALAAVPILIVEARRALRGEVCTCG